jgi:alkaline phosphatase D
MSNFTRRKFLRSVAGAMLGASALGRATWAFGPRAGGAQAQTQADPELVLAFGSCNRQWNSQRNWSRIGTVNADAWIWLGDIIYSDFFSPAARKRAYDGLRRDEYYREFAARVPRILGTWDDHDYGFNNSGRDFKDKVSSQRLLLDFLGVPADDPRRQREGVYNSHTFEKAGRRVKTILLDLRYFRDKSKRDSELLGEAQWRWFEAELAEAAGCDLVVIGSSMQYLGPMTDGDDWNGFPTERMRMRELLEQAPAPVMILSGDVHGSELSRVEFNGARTGQRWLYDFTASGITHGNSMTPNPRRLGKPCGENNFGVLRLGLPADGSPVKVTFETWLADTGKRFQAQVAEGLGRV